MTNCPGLPRRTFLKMTAGAAAALTSPVAAFAAGPKVHIMVDERDEVASSVPGRWAAEHLAQALEEKGIAAQTVSAVEHGAAAATVVVLSSSVRVPAGFRSAKAAAQHPEAVRLVPGRVAGIPATLVWASGAAGLVYGVTDLADRVRNGADPIDALAVPATVEETPANEVRSIARAFCSEVEDKPWFYSKDFWTSYLDALATARFNRFNLAFGFGYDFPKGVTEDYFHFPYPYLVTVPGYDVRVVPLAEGERERNLQTLRFIAAETARRGLQFQLGLWTHAYEWTDSPKAYHRIEGLTPSNHAAYSRDALAILLKECPEITGLTMRVHGESGVPEGSYDFWRTLFQAIKNCGRRVELDMHAKGINQIMIDMANDTGMPVKIGAKSWAEHMGLGYHQADIRELEIPRPERMETGVFSVSNGERRFTRYGYADLFQESRKYNVLFRLWPGTQRHLLWGDPEMAAAYSRTAHFCGAAGLEICEPLTFKGREGSGHPGGRCDYVDPSLEPQHDWEKYAYTYRLWGRKLYNPDAAPETWRGLLVRPFGGGAISAETALASASRVLPLVTTAHLPSASNHSFWPEMYTNMPITPGLRSPYADTPKPYRFGTVSPLDPQLFAPINEFVTDELAGKRTVRYSPLTVAAWLAGFTTRSAAALGQMRSSSARKNSAEYRRWEEDVLIQIGLGQFFSAKLRSGVAFEVFLHTGDAGAGQLALQQYTEARTAWATMAERAATVYKADVDYGEIPMRRGHWTDRLPAIDEDLKAMEAALQQKPEGASASPHSSPMLGMIRGTPSRAQLPATHVPPNAFAPGKPLALQVSAGRVVDGAELFYRHVNQGERWRSVPMSPQGASFHAEIPADYSASVYPLQYYFVLTHKEGKSFHPEFNDTLSNQPYFAVWHRV